MPSGYIEGVNITYVYLIILGSRTAKQSYSWRRDFQHTFRKQYSSQYFHSNQVNNIISYTRQKKSHFNFLRSSPSTCCQNGYGQLSILVFCSWRSGLSFRMRRRVISPYWDEFGEHKSFFQRDYHDSQSSQAIWFAELAFEPWRKDASSTKDLRMCREIMRRPREMRRRDDEQWERLCQENESNQKSQLNGLH